MVSVTWRSGFGKHELNLPRCLRGRKGVVSACRRIGVSAYRRIDVSTCRRIGVSPSKSRTAFVEGHRLLFDKVFATKINGSTNDRVPSTGASSTVEHSKRIRTVRNSNRENSRQDHKTLALEEESGIR
jgi:hypothetical protein